MKWMQIYLVGYAIVLCGVIAALWKMGVLERAGPAWTAIGIVDRHRDRLHGLGRQQREEGNGRDRQEALSRPGRPLRDS